MVTLNKPDKKNALGDILTPALRQTLAKLDTEGSVGCVLITGAGNAFCSGGDVSGMSGSHETAPKTSAERVAELTHKQETLTYRLFNLSKITIAALPGAAAGLAIAFACDLRVAAESAFVTTAFVNIGLSGDYGGTWLLSRLIGLSKAKELYYTADRVYASEAAQLDLINKVYSDASFPTDAFAFAKKLVNGPTEALGRMKENLNAGIQQGLRESLVLEAKNMIASHGTAESREAIRAFMEKRPANFH